MFLYVSFETKEETEDFCSRVFPTHLTNNIKFIIEGTENVLVIFDSDKSREELAAEMYLILTPDFIKFYFLFEIDKLITANIPESIKEFIFSHKKKSEKLSDKVDTIMMIDFKKNIKSNKKELNLDEILEKIDQSGVDSLTPEEKNFLDNFKNN